MSKQRLALAVTSMAAAIVLLSPHVAGRNAIFTVNGQNLYIETLGASGPTVVFEAGLGNDSTTWKSVAASIAKFARVVLYDRAGLGQSVPMMNKTSAVTADEVATDLEALLSAADIRPPYFLVGHSLDGLYVQMFTLKYPKQVSGVVLVDSSSPDAPGELKTLARLEPGTAAYFEEEGVAESNKQILNGGSFPPVVLTVIAATDHGPFFREWEPTLMRLQQQLATLSPLSTLIVAQGSGHDVQVDRPEIVVDAVSRMIKEAKQ